MSTKQSPTDKKPSPVSRYPFPSSNTLMRTIFTSSSAISKTSGYDSITSTVHNGNNDKTFLGDPTLEGAFKFIARILIYCGVLLLRFSFFAILTCRIIRRKNREEAQTHMELKTMGARCEQIQGCVQLDNDQSSTNSTTPIANMRVAMPIKPEQIKQPREFTSRHEIRCYPKFNTHPTTDSNVESNNIHDLYFNSNDDNHLSPSLRSSYTLPDQSELPRPYSPPHLRHPLDEPVYAQRVKNINLHTKDQRDYLITRRNKSIEP